MRKHKSHPMTDSCNWLATKSTNLILGVIGALIGGFIISSRLGLRYDEGLNLASIAVATLGAVILRRAQVTLDAMIDRPHEESLARLEALAKLMDGSL